MGNKSYTIGNIKVVEWDNGDDKPKNYTCEKFYKDSEDNWKTSKSFNFSELQLLSHLIQEIKREKMRLKVDDN